MESQNFFSLEGLTDLGRSSGIDMRPTLLRVLTDLYVHRLSHTAEEERHYTELALRMLEAVDVPTRVAVAKRFSRYLSPPLRILQWLARDLPVVAAELRAHPLLQPPAAPPSRSAVALDAEADNERVLQPSPASRTIDAATAAELNELFFTASADERKLILLNLDVVAPTSANGSRAAADPLVGQELEAAILTGKTEHFIARLAQALLIPHHQAQRIARDEFGEPVVVAAKALALPRQVLCRVLIFVNPAVGHSVERVHALAALYDDMTMPAAESMLAIWQALHNDESARAKYRPLVWDDETRRRVRQGLTVRRKPLAPQTGDRRSAS
jgi:uncharacterized protein (DUF2336 family)